MSALPLYEVELSRDLRPRTARIDLRHEPLAQPRQKRRAQPKPKSADQFVISVVQFACIAAFVCYSSSLGGQVLLEKARREQIRAVVRKEEAVRSGLEVRNRLNQLYDSTRIENWALENGFVTGPHVMATGTPVSHHEGLVAINR